MTQARSRSRSRVSRGRISSSTKPAHPGQLGLVFRFRLENPRPWRPPVVVPPVGPAARYRGPVPGNASVTPTCSTVSLRAPVDACPVGPRPTGPRPTGPAARIRRRRGGPARRAPAPHAPRNWRSGRVPDESVTALAALAHEVRLAWCGPEVEVEGILSAKTGGCPEDCHFCAQSSRFETPVKATPFLDTDEVLRGGRGEGGRSVGVLPGAGRPGPRRADPHRILELVPLVQEPTGLNVAVSAGILDRRPGPQAGRRGGPPLQPQPGDGPLLLPRGRHHPHLGRAAATCQRVLDHGMELCCGALVGMGESDAQRVELLLQLRDLGPPRSPSIS